jgi:ABC-2 type transport system permease protein
MQPENMSSQPNTMSESFQAQRVVPIAISPTRAWYWSLRREFWENRYIYIAPVAVAIATLFAFLIATIGRAMSIADLAQRRAVLEERSTFAAVLIMAATFIVAVFYCLEALHGERRDRSILFWKSLPVSDLTTVLSKASIPILIIPLLTFAITIVTQFIMLILSTAALLASGMSAATLWTPSSFQMSLMVLHHLVVIHGFWYAPIYGWLLLVSAWSRRVAFLWAALPLAAIGAIEKIAFNTSHFFNFVGDRISGGTEGAAFNAEGMAIHPLAHIHLGQFLISPSLWIGFLFAAGCLALAVRLRRHRGPI